MRKRKRTGLVCTVEAVQDGHQVGIAWTENEEGREIGFVYDEDETPRGEVPEKVASFCEEKGYAVADHLGKSDWMAQAHIEEVSQETFFDWFGGYPVRPALFFDAWGAPDDFRAAYGIPEGSTTDENDEYRKASRKAGLLAGAFTALAFVLAVLAFVVVAWAISGALPLTVTVYTLLAVVLMGLGVVFIMAEMQNVARYFYRRQLRK